MGMRPNKLASTIKKEVSHILIEKMRDPRLGFITITDVRLTNDLKTAIIYFTVLGDEKSIRNAFFGLKSATKYIKGVIGNNVPVKYVPNLIFEYDKSVAHLQKVDSLLRQIQEEKEGDQLSSNE